MASGELRVSNGDASGVDKQAAAAAESDLTVAGAASDSQEQPPFPARYQIVLSCMAAFIICNMVRLVLRILSTAPAAPHWHRSPHINVGHHSLNDASTEWAIQTARPASIARFSQSVPRGG